MPMRPNTITFDGDTTDWDPWPMIIRANDNLQDYFPDEVGAAFSDRVDVANVKSFVNMEEDAMYFLIYFHGGPVWPNFGYTEQFEGTDVARHRGYYHLMVDLDNDPTTGWNSHWYETHFTPVGYYAGQGIPNMDPIGAEMYLEFGVDVNWSPPKGDGTVKYTTYYAEDVHEIDYRAGTGNGYDMFGFGPEIATWPMTYKFDGYMREQDVGETEGLYWCGHAWGMNTLEFGVTLEYVRKYWAAMGKSYLNPGDEIGVCAFIETPVDDWGVDVSPRGAVSLIETSVEEQQEMLPQTFALENNYPNPFNPETHINYALPKASQVTLKIYNTLGQLVRTLVDHRISAGRHSVTWDGRDDHGTLVSSGIYFYSLKTNEKQLTKRMTFLK
jgi:hypothetical protein